MVALKDALILNNKEIWDHIFISENILSKLSKQQQFEKLNMTFQNAFNLKDHSAKQLKILNTFDEVCMGIDLKQYINEQLEKTKGLKLQLDTAKDDLYDKQTQDEDESMQPQIIKDFKGQEQQYLNHLEKIKHDPKLIEAELQNRIDTIKTMRDGAEMDLDLEITQRMIEDEEDYIEKINMVIPQIQDANLVLKMENEMLDKEYKWYENVLLGFDN